jgi:small subunit ribosomal protein S6
MNRTYEVIFILRPDMVEEEADRLVATLEEAATQAGAVLRKTDRIGKRRLAYRVRGFRDGNYVLFDLEASAEAIRELQRRLRVSEAVIKFLAVRTDELEKRFQKRQKQREDRRLRRPAPEAEAPSQEDAMEQQVEGEGTDAGSAAQ